MIVGTSSDDPALSGATRHEVVAPDGAVLVVHRVRPDPASLGRGPTLVWHHGSPQTGAPLAPVVAAARARGITLVTAARPSYGGSSAQPGRDVASVAAGLERVLDALGVQEYVAMGASGGGPHALACAARSPDRVTGVVTLAGLCPLRTDGSAAGDGGLGIGAWTAGMVAPGGLLAATRGRAARAAFAVTDEFDPASFVDEDFAALAGPWAALGRDAGRAEQDGPDGLIDDDVAFTGPWGFEPAAVAAPVLVVQGGRDRVVPPAHAEALVAGCPAGQLWLRPRDGHVSVLGAVAVAMDWLLDLGRPS